MTDFGKIWMVWLSAVCRLNYMDKKFSSVKLWGVLTFNPTNPLLSTLLANVLWNTVFTEENCDRPTVGLYVHEVQIL